MGKSPFRVETIIVDTVVDAEEQGKPYMKVIDMAGNLWKIKQGQNGALKEKWHLLKHGVAIRVIVGLYKGYEYVDDIETVINVLEAEAAKKLQEQQKREKESSIEAQTAVKSITDQQVAGIINIPQDLLDARDAWERHALRDYIK